MNDVPECLPSARWAVSLKRPRMCSSTASPTWAGTVSTVSGWWLSPLQVVETPVKSSLSNPWQRVGGAELWYSLKCRIKMKYLHCTAFHIWSIGRLPDLLVNNVRSKLLKVYVWIRGKRCPSPHAWWDYNVQNGMHSFGTLFGLSVRNTSAIIAMRKEITVYNVKILQ